ncbi:3-oxoacyl-ACP synthase [Thermobifida halotolerans]|uniref:3-oxoacyl-ACP synthase n=1 Tax=Thermobifida halotolerans TaxID=483545 RepID=A0A399G6M8_9ACTN|nr:3-oxoacyl-[acyl-carrier-protein] synthase III C-terminal domain-containing protein [Thermobifida halotolerans]UOE20563.1 3-oxoacyl-ACP synthase [Thermobifida halotolerans]
MPIPRFESLGAYLPENEVSTRDLVSRMDHQPVFDLGAITGIHHRRFAGADEDSFTMALRAARDCLSRSSHPAGELDVVISTSITRFKDRDRFYFEPSFAHMVAREIGATSAVCFDVSNACAGMITGVAVLERMVRAGTARSGMVVSGERISVIAETAVREIDHPHDPQFASLTVGDSAAAVVVDGRGTAEERIDYVELTTSAAHADLCIGMPSDRSQGVALYTDNQSMHATERVALWPTFQRDFLAKRGTSFAEEGYDFVIHHQIGTRLTDKAQRMAARLFNTPMPPSPMVVDRYGNTSSTSHFVVLYEHLRDGSIPPGSKLLLVPAASGIVTGCLAATVSSIGI